MTTRLPHSYTPSTAGWPQGVFDDCNELQRQANHLFRLAQAFALTGNDTMADDLFAVSHTLGKIEYNQREMVGVKTAADLREAAQMTGAVVSAALGGLQLSRS